MAHNGIKNGYTSNYRYLQVYAPTAQGGITDALDKVWGFAKDVGKGAVNLYGTSQQQKGQMDLLKAQMAADQNQGMPGWILPVAIGGGALAMILLLKKRRGR